MKEIKLLLFGIALILTGTIFAVFSAVSDSYTLIAFSFIFPFTGIVLCCIGLCTNSETDKSSSQENKNGKTGNSSNQENE